MLHVQQGSLSMHFQCELALLHRHLPLLIQATLHLFRKRWNRTVNRKPNRFGTGTVGTSHENRTGRTETDVRFHGNPIDLILGPHGTPWGPVHFRDPMGPHGFPWGPMGTRGSPCVSKGPHVLPMRPHRSP